MDVPQSSPLRSGLPASLGLVVAFAGNLFAQSAVPVSQNTFFFKDPGGIRLGAIAAGAAVVPGRVSGGFSEVVLDGWIFAASTRADAREGFDLSVVPAGGENIRIAPDGRILARAIQGALFSRVQTRGGWIRVRRTAWVARSALPAVSARRDSGNAAPPRSRTQVAEVPPPSAPRSEDRLAMVRSGAIIQRTPDGPGFATLMGPTTVAMGEQKGEWVAVTLQGWVRRTEVDSAMAARPAISAAMLRENPERFVGQSVDWRVQFLAFQQADELRPEMPLGQSYLLARGPLPESGFVYVMMSKEQVEQLKGTNPLDELALTVTIRAGRTRYLATPVVELVRRNR